MVKVYSSLSNNQTVTVMKKSDNTKQVSKNVVERAIIINGKANVADKVTRKQSKFVETEVSAEDAKILAEHPALKVQIEKGFISIGKKPESMPKDKSAQLDKTALKASGAKKAAKEDDE